MNSDDEKHKTLPPHPWAGGPTLTAVSPRRGWVGISGSDIFHSNATPGNTNVSSGHWCCSVRKWREDERGSSPSVRTGWRSFRSNDRSLRDFTLFTDLSQTELKVIGRKTQPCPATAGWFFSRLDFVVGCSLWLIICYQEKQRDFGLNRLVEIPSNTNIQATLHIF